VQSQRAKEANLVRRAQMGDAEAFDELVRQNAPRLFQVVRRLASDTAGAEAIVQEAFLRIWKNLHRYRHEGPFFPYLVTIALNVGRDQWRKARGFEFHTLEPYEESLPDPDPIPEALVEQRETLEALAQAVAELPAAYRAVIALRYDAELSYAEIAAALDIPVNTVRTHLRRAKLHLRRLLMEKEAQHG